MKKIISLIFILFMSITVHASDISTALNGESVVSPGELVTFTIKLESNDTVYAYKLDLNYDDTFKLQSVTNSGDFYGSNNINKKTLIFRSEGKSGEFEVAKLAFLVNSNNYSKNSVISINGLVCMTKTDIKGSSDFCKGGEVKQVDVYKKTVDIKSNNNFLKNIQINNKILDNFSKEDDNYEMTIDEDKDELLINAEAEDTKSTIDGLGTIAIGYGENNLKITVVAENGASRSYNLKLIRKDSRKSDNDLKTIIINNKKISKFKSNTLLYRYYVYQIKNPSDVNIAAVTSDPQATYTIEQPKTIVKGENIYKIHVKSEKGEINIYTIKVINVHEEISKKLETLSIIGYNLKFDKNTTHYELYYNLDKINNLKVVYKTISKPEYVDVRTNIDLNSPKLSHSLKVGDKLIITIEGIDGKKEEYKIVFKKDNRINFFGIVLTSIFIILNIIIFKIIINKRDKNLIRVAKHIEEPKEIKEPVLDDLDKTKELTDEELKRIRR